MGRIIQVFEYERLTTSKDSLGRYLTLTELQKLYDYNDKNNNTYFTGIRDGIKFQNFVGVIQIGGLTLEILPKTDRKQHSTDKEYTQWQGALLRMLGICNYIKVDSVSETDLERRYHSLLDLYFSLFLDEVNGLLRQGLIKKYRKNDGQVKALKGRLNFSQQIQQNLVHQERFYTCHEVYDYEHLHNQILVKALSVLVIVSNNVAITDRINRIKLDFPEIKELEITKVHFDLLRDNRKTEPYKTAIKIAKMIILNYSPDIKSGGENMLALLFDMNKLWEEYVYRMLIRVKSKEYSVNFQNSKKFWENKTIRPDLVVHRKYADSKSEKYIIDTKWKIIDEKHPSDDDLKQMFAYNLYWDAGKSMLLYPKTNNHIESFGTFHKTLLPENKCKLGFVHILDDKGLLDMNIGKEILSKLD
jgi:5-methylcytosine-specific restriction enzyme subunit McrC